MFIHVDKTKSMKKSNVYTCGQDKINEKPNVYTCGKDKVNDRGHRGSDRMVVYNYLYNKCLSSLML